MRYAFIREQEDQYPVRRLCKVMALHPSGYYAWRTTPQSKRKIENQRLLGHIKQSWLESGAVYGYRKVHDDLRELGETCGHNRVYRLMRHASIRSQTGYHRRPGHRGGPAAVVDWTTDVLRFFPAIGELQTPWRWRKAGTEALGQWLLTSRQILHAGGALDLRTAPQELNWIALGAGTADRQRLMAARINAPHRDGTVLVIGDSMNVQGRRQMASQTPGATHVEPVELRDLTDFARGFDINAENAFERLATFAGSVMTNVGVPDLLKRVNSLRQGTARIPPSPSEEAAVTFVNAPSLNNALSLLRRIVEQANVRVYRPDIWRSCLAALQAACDSGCSFHEAAIREREKNRYIGRPISRRAVGSTLLLKGLEADVAIVLHPESMDARHLYVALTRGANRVVVCSDTPVLTPSQ